MHYAIDVPAVILAFGLLLLLLYMEQRRFGKSIHAWRASHGWTREKAAEELSHSWNEKYPNNKKDFSSRTIERWEAGRGLPYLMTQLRIKQILDDPVAFNNIAIQARREDLDILDAFVGKRTPESPPRMAAMTIEAFKAFYEQELKESDDNPN